MTNLTCPECGESKFVHPKGLGAHRAIKHGVVGSRRVAMSLAGRPAPNHAAPRTNGDLALAVMAEIDRLRLERAKIDERIERLEAVASDGGICG